MSNFSARPLTRNQHKQLNKSKEKEEVPVQKTINTSKIVNENNRVDIETDEEYHKQQNKKLKTENNSQSKNAIHVPQISSKINLHDSLKLLQVCSADTEAL